MQHFRKVSSLQEDFESLGLVKRGEAPLTESQEPVNNEPANTDPPSTEPGEGGEDGELGEARLVRQKMRRMKAGERSKARMSYRKKKAKIRRARKMRKRKSSFKRRVKRMASLKKGKKAGVRRRFRLVAGFEGRPANLLESLKDLKVELTGNVMEELNKAFKGVIALGTTLARKFAMAEEIMIQLEQTIEHPESEHDQTGSTNAKEGGKTGDAIDTVADAQPKTGEVSMEQNPKGPGDEDDDQWSDDDDDMGDDAGDDSGDDSGYEDEDDDEYEDEEVEESKGMEHDLMQLCLEAEDVLDAMKTSVLSPDEAAGVLKDMVSYLGGALKVWLDLATNLSKYMYIGQDGPSPISQSPDVVAPNNQQIGQGAPQPTGVAPDAVAPTK